MPAVTIYSLHHSEHPLTTYLHCRWQEQKTQNWHHTKKPQVEANAQWECNTWVLDKEKGSWLEVEVVDGVLKLALNCLMGLKWLLSTFAWITVRSSLCLWSWQRCVAKSLTVDKGLARFRTRWQGLYQMVKQAQCNSPPLFVQLGLFGFLMSTKESSSNTTLSILRGEAHLLPVSSSTQLRWWRWTKRGVELRLLVYLS